jgi:hypothetical protein
MASKVWLSPAASLLATAPPRFRPARVLQRRRAAAEEQHQQQQQQVVVVLPRRRRWRLRLPRATEQQQQQQQQQEDEEEVVDSNVLPYCSIDRKQKKTIGEMEQEFLQALQSFYYDQKAIMSNEEFDNLKEELMWEGSTVVMLSKCYSHLLLY